METYNLSSLLHDNIIEVIGESEIKAKLENNPRLTIYWGTAPTAPPHFAYYFPLLKLRQFVLAGHRVKILIADVHSYLDMGFNSYEKVEARSTFYQMVITKMLEVLGVEEKSVEFIKGSSYQLDHRYNLDLKKLESTVTLRDAKRAANDVVKTSKNPILSSIVYPLMQCLDERYMEADIELGGNDQRSIFMLSRDHIEKIGYHKCSYLITALIPALDNKSYKMSSSGNSKLCFKDSNDIINQKITKAYCVDGCDEINRSPLLAILKYIIFPTKHQFTVEREEKYGGTKIYISYLDLEMDWKNKTLSGADLKPNLSRYVCELIDPVRQCIELNPDIYNDAYCT